MGYEWDPAKAAANVERHGVSFADAVTALEDELALTIPDPDSVGEDRFVSVGMDATGQILVTVFTFRGDVVRIKSSRKPRKVSGNATRNCHEKGIRFQQRQAWSDSSNAREDAHHNSA